MSKDKKTDLEKGHKEWRGYSYDELRYRQAYVKVRLELEKERMLAQSAQMAQGGFLPGKGGSRRIVGKLIGALDYIDYAFLAYRVGSKLFKIFRKRRK